MNNILFPFMLLAAAGLALSICVHLAALLGLPIPGDRAVWGLHMGIFVVWVPTVLVSTRVTGFTGRRDFWKVVLSGCPAWMRYAVFGLFGYALVNFALFISTVEGQGSTAGTGTELRGFSGHWMAFYGAAFATLYSVIRSPHLLRKRQCPRGHGVGPDDQYCRRCGEALPAPPNQS